MASGYSRKALRWSLDGFPHRCDSLLPTRARAAARTYQRLLQRVTGRNDLFELLWGLTALGALLLLAGLMKWNRKVLTAASICWSVAGTLFVSFSVMNFCTSACY